jgi:hypothetical protein
MKRFTSVAAAMFVAAFLGVTHTQLGADSNIDQRTYLTFSGPVQMPGVTLPAGKYVFRLADTATRNVMQVFDEGERNILGQWFFVPANRTSEQMSVANGKPVVTFHETPEGMAPPIQYFFYPTDLTGKEFIYPKAQAIKIAAATHEGVLATDSDAAKGGEAGIVRISPSGSETDYEATAENGQAPAPAPAATASQRADRERPAATAGVTQQAPATGEPRQVAASELPRTASSLPYFGLIGLLALTAGMGLRLARASR